MKKIIQNPKKRIIIFQLLLLILLVQNNYDQTVSANHSSTNDIVFTIYIDNILHIEWENINGAISYEINVSFNNSSQPIRTTSTNNMVNIPLSRNRDINRICITTIHQTNQKVGDINCLDIPPGDLTTVATIAPVFGGTGNKIALKSVAQQVENATTCDMVSFYEMCGEELDMPFDRIELLPILKSINEDNIINANSYCSILKISIDTYNNTNNPIYSQTNILQELCFRLNTETNPNPNPNPNRIHSDKEQTSIQKPNSFSPQITPNPITTHTQIHYELPEKSPIQFYLFDQSGNTIQHISTTQNKGQQTLPIDAAHFPTGIYYYTFITNREKHQGKLIKID